MEKRGKRRLYKVLEKGCIGKRRKNEAFLKLWQKKEIGEKKGKKIFRSLCNPVKRYIGKKWGRKEALVRFHQ